MRVALDEQIFAIQRYGGISRLFAELARQFVNHAVDDLELLPLHAPIINRYLLDDFRVRDALHAKEASSEWLALLRYGTRIKTHPQAEIVHNTFYLPHGLAPTRGAKRIVTIHDMIPELMPKTRRRLDLLTLKKRYVQQADHIICVSQAAKSDLLHVYGTVKAPITVVHHGVDSRFQPTQTRITTLPDRYLLFVGNRDQYKDANVLFQAFAALEHEFKDLHIICIGGGAFTAAELSLLQRLGIQNRVAQLNLSDQEMVSAYSHAELFVFPSRFEGFGLPVLEAMACGTPTLLARATALPEVGAEAAHYFEPGNAESLTSELQILLQNPQARTKLSEAGQIRAQQFTWANTARNTAAVYQQALNS